MVALVLKVVKYGVETDVSDFLASRNAHSV